MNQKEIIKTLKEGNERFKANKEINHDYSQASLKEFEKGQNPFAIVLSCSDSRVSPNIIFDQKLGSLFTIENAGNALSDSALASIQYAVNELKIKVLVLVGHSHCGAIGAACTDIEFEDDLGLLINDIRSHITSKDSVVACQEHL